MFFSPQLAAMPMGKRPATAAATPATWDPGHLADASSTLSNSNKTMTFDAPPFGLNGGTRTTVSMSASEKIYIEFTITNAGGSDNAQVGIINGSYTLGDSMINTANAWGWRDGGLAGYNGTNSFVNGYGSGIVGRLAIDFGTKKIWSTVDGNAWLGAGGSSGDPAAGTNGDDFTGLGSTVWFACQQVENHKAITIRASSADWTYSPPSGFSQLAQ
jgi:hypothetical protein